MEKRDDSDAERSPDEWLISAAKRGSAEELALALSRGADPNACDRRYASSALTWAVDSDAWNFDGLLDEPPSQERMLCAKLLLAAGARVDAKNKLGTTPLLAALGCAKRVELLIAAGADPNESSAGEGISALMAASGFAADPRSIEALVSAGADLEARSANGMTAMFWAAASGRLSRMKKLAELGASVEVVNGQGKSLEEAASGKANETSMRAWIVSMKLAKIIPDPGGERAAPRL